MVAWYTDIKQDICHGDAMKDITNPKKVRDYFESTELKNIFSWDVAQSCRLFSYEDGEQLCREGEEVHYLLFLVEGMAKPYGMLANGRAYLFRIESPLSVYGDLEVLEESAYKDNVASVGGCICMAIPIGYIRKYCLDSPKFLKYIISTLSDRLAMISRNSMESLLLPLKCKVAIYLLDESQGGKRHLRISGTYLELAENLGTTYRHLSRVLREMVADGFIERQGKNITLLDMDGLNRLI